MAEPTDDQEQAGLAPDASVFSDEQHIDPGAPVIFVDGAINISPSPYVMKIYWGRVESNLQKAAGPEVGRVVLQTVVPANAFIQTAGFFNNMIKRMIALKMFTAEQVEEIQKASGGA